MAAPAAATDAGVDLSLAPLDGSLRVWLFKDVENIESLRAAVVAGDVPVDFAYLNAALVPGLRGLTLAAFAARAATARGRARTRSPCTELVVALSGGRNISTALSTFGLSPSARHLLVCRFDAAPEDGSAAAAAVQGTAAPIGQLESVRDEAAMKKAFSIAGGEVGPLDDAAVCRIAAREC